MLEGFQAACHPRRRIPHLHREYCAILGSPSPTLSAHLSTTPRDQLLTTRELLDIDATDPVSAYFLSKCGTHIHVLVFLSTEASYITGSDVVVHNLMAGSKGPFPRKQET